MRTLRLMIVGAFLTGLFAVSALAQAGANSTKIAVINTLAFANEKGGITKYVNAQKKLDAEFKVETQQLQTLANRINALKTEIANLQKTNPNVPINKSTVTNKASEHDSLTRQLKFKQDDAKARYEARSQAVLGPVSRDIGVALQEFAKQKGYGLILDAAKLDRAGLILAFDQKFNLTSQFIAYYNTRPAATASTTK